jgi:hypothetical protein
MNLRLSCFRHRAGATLAVACVALLLCTPAHAARRGRSRSRPHPNAAAAVRPVALPTAPAAAAGMIIAIDPETGALGVPTAEQLRRLTAAERTGLMRTSEGLQEVRFPDGSVMVDLQGRFVEFSVVQLDAVGCPHFLSVNDAAALLALLASPAPASPPAREEK